MIDPVCSLPHPPLSPRMNEILLCSSFSQFFAQVLLPFGSQYVSNEASDSNCMTYHPKRIKNDFSANITPVEKVGP